jgi:hypothetical protein
MGATCCTEKINEMEIHMKKQADDKVKGAIETQLPLTPEYATPYHPLGIKGTPLVNQRSKVWDLKTALLALKVLEQTRKNIT